MKPVSIRTGDLLPWVFLFLAALSATLYFDNSIYIFIPFILLTFYAGWIQPRWIFFILLISLPFSFEFEFGNGLATDIPDESLMVLLTLLVVFTFASRPNLISKREQSHPLMMVLYCWLGWILVSCFLSTEPLISFKYLLAKSWYVGAFVFALLLWGRQEIFLRTAILCLVFSLMLVMSLVLYNHSLTGFSFATVNDAVEPFFRNHVNYSAMLVCMVPVLVGIYRYSGNKRSRFMIGLLLLLVVFALFFSYARGAWLALLAGIMSDWLIRKKMMLSFFLFMVAAALAILFWLKKDERYVEFAPHYQTTIFHTDFKEHLIATYRLKDLSSAERFYRWIAGINMISDRPLSGFGPNTFYNNYKSYTVPAYKTWVSDNQERSGVHNYFLLLGIEQGMPGLVLFLVLAGLMIFYSQRNYHGSENILYKQIALSAGVVTVMILVLNFLSDLVETDKVGSLFFLCLGLLILSDPRSHMKRIPKTVTE